MGAIIVGGIAPHRIVGPSHPARRGVPFRTPALAGQGPPGPRRALFGLEHSPTPTIIKVKAALLFYSHRFYT
jgi:hypothetical protein